ncbi:MAG: hypothetical protein ABIU11_02495 [Chitinophagaceae bacterium]
MKKMMLTLAIGICTLSAFAGEEKVSSKVLNAFNTEFTTAQKVEWTLANNFYTAKFTFNEKYVFAYYSTEGDLLAVTHYVTPVELPIALQNSLKKNYAEYWVTDLFEIAKDGTTNYYITIEKADKKIIMQSSAGTVWNVFRKIKKV